MKFKVISIAFLLGLGLELNAQKISGWRPENRTGVSAETGLMKSWPQDGPALLWSNLELGKGYSSPSFGSNTIYITGTAGKDDLLYALDMKGKILWKSVMGRSWNRTFPESRATPTVEGDRVYTCSGYGDLACFDGKTGKVIWSYKASELNKGTYGEWGIAESLLIDGDKLYYTPGGPETMTIALNKNTAALVWKSASINDKPGYVSPILINRGTRKIIINVAMNHVFAVDAADGKVLWTIENEQSSDVNMRQWDLIKCTTPLYSDGMVYVTGGYDTGGMMIKMSDDGSGAKVVWTDRHLDDHHGGVVLINGYIYGSNWINNGLGNWCCIEWNTGRKMWEQHWNNKGSVIAAEGLLYIYEEKNGNVGLLKADPQKFDLVSSFRFSLGDMGPFWAHPVIHDGVLYLRHSNALAAYNIKAK
ncbi:MAG TPA: PQQ-binding-like beta-propeller repeat protein [Bacteroidales bacterium]|nr:PQQ-binding-like beta-propeller repeat protein [Bacteroidales bacterium]